MSKVQKIHCYHRWVCGITIM